MTDTEVQLIEEQLNSDAPAADLCLICGVAHDLGLDLCQ